MTKNIFFTTLLVLIVALVCEVVFRTAMNINFAILEKRNSVRWEATQDKLKLYSFPKIKWGKSHEFKSDKGEFRYTLDEQGFRGSKNPIGAGQKRVLVLGDSYTFGWAVNDNETYSYHLNNFLGPSYHIYNAGIPGYSISSEFGVMLELIDRQQPDIVILGFVMNDAQPGQYFPGAIAPHIKYKYQFSWILAEVKHLINNFLGNQNKIFKNVLFLPQKNYLQDFDENGLGWKNVTETLLEMNEMAQTKNIRFVVVILPDFNQKFDKYAYLTIHNKLSRWLKENEFETYDLLEYFKELDSSILRVSWDGHPNNSAHEIIGKILSKKIDEKERSSEDD